MSDKLKIMQEKLKQPSKKKKVVDTRLFGIDISHHQENPQWDKVLQAGVKFAFLKATEASTFKDSKFKANRQGATDVGIPVGAYHFFRPQSNIQAQIRNFLSTVGEMKVGELPPVLDLEVPESWKRLSLNQRVKITRQWLDGVEAALGVRPIIYLSNSFAKDILGSQKWFQDYILWLAHYTKAANPKVPEPWKSGSNWAFWQYSETGKLDGIKDNFVDFNRFAGDLAALDKLLWKKE